MFSKLGIEFHETTQETVADYLDSLLSKPHNVFLEDERDALALWSTFYFQEPVFILDRERTRHEHELQIAVDYTTKPLTVQLSEKSTREFDHGFGRFHARAFSNGGLPSSAAAG